MSEEDKRVLKALLDIGFSSIGSYGKLDADNCDVEFYEYQRATHVYKHKISYCDGGILAVIGEHEWLTMPTKSDLWLEEDSLNLLSDEDTIALTQKTIIKTIELGIPGQLTLF